MAMSPRLLRPRASAGYGLDARDWQSRVVANGGTVSATTMKAVDTFCKTIVTAGIRDRFYRLNLFAGTGLSAALVPLFRGPSLGGTQAGNVTDTNFNFVSGDYVEGAGLAGNGTNKHLRIGTLSSVYQGVPATGHMAVRTTGASGAGRRAMGVFDLVTQSGQPYSMYYGVYRGGQGQMEFGRGGISVRTPTSANALILINRSSTTSLEYYENSSQIGSATTNESINRDIPSAEISVFGQSYYNWTNATFSHGYEPPAATFSSYSCGLSMSGSQVAAYSGALNTFLAAMGRS
jgi:hypothetical protein